MKKIFQLIKNQKQHNRRETEIFIKHMPKWYKTLVLNFWSNSFRFFTLFLLLFSMPLNQERFQDFWEEIMQTNYNWTLWNNILFIITIIGILYWLFYLFLKLILGFVFIKEILSDKTLNAKKHWIFNRVILVIFIIVIIILSLCWYYLNVVLK